MSNLTQIQSGNVNAGQTNVVMLRFQVDCSNPGDGTCLLSTITTGDAGTAGAGDWSSLEIYIDTDTGFAGSTLIGQSASWDGTSTTVTLNQGAQADRTVTNGTPKYIFIVYNLTEAAEGETIDAVVTALAVASPDNGVSGLGYASAYIGVNADSLSTSNNTPVQAVDPNVGDQNVVMQRFQVDCDTAGNNSCILSTMTVDDLGTASTGDWDNLEIYIDTDTNFTGATRIGQAASWDGASTAVSLNQGTTADRTVTNGTSKYIFIVYDINSGAGGVTIQNRVTAVGVSSPDTGVTGLAYNSNLLTVQGASADTLSTSAPITVRTGYADIGENSLVMQRFKVDCDNSADGSCLLSSVTVDDLGTGASGDWDYLQVYIDTDTLFAGAVKIGQTASWNGASTAVTIDLGTAADRTVTFGTSKYVFIVYDLSATIAAGDTLKSRVTAVGAASPDNGVSGLTYDSNQLTATEAISVYGTCGVACVATTTGQCCNTITQAIGRNDSTTRPIIVYDGTYSESVNLMNKSDRYLQSANGPESTIIDGGTYTFLLQTSYNITLDGFGHMGSTYGIQANGNTTTTVRNCDIYSNTSRGINVSSGTNVTLSVSSCDIYSNAGGAGAGIYLNGGNITVENSKIYGNAGTGSGTLYQVNATTTFRNVIMTGNTAYDGGAAYFNSGTFNCYNCTISGNYASNIGGGLRVASTTVTLRNSIMYNNYAVGQGDELYLVSGSTTLDYSFIKTGASYIQGGPPTLTNTINDDTNLLFIDKRDPSATATIDGDYHLRAGSPCINSGTITNAVSPDIDGDSRPQGGGYDMGADEYAP
ncbi:MAG: right-handed parallel beta-helix repeat-containing protein [Nitrospirae bacterium]|nr:right-handed parallel beta-helix repeat-containing protein [Nitrospirota bacterium]